MNGLWLASYVALWVLFLVVAVVLVSVLRNLGVVYETLDRLDLNGENETKLIIGDKLPDLSLVTLSNEHVSLTTFYGSKSAVFVVSPECSPCQDLISAIATHSLPLDLRDVEVRQHIVISTGAVSETITFIQGLDLQTNVQVLVDVTGSVKTLWGVNGTPLIIFFDEQGHVLRQSLGFNAPSSQQSTLAVANH
jgi:peroxiredoxin